ncbi:MAG: FkbM family methyltransferase [Bacteroidota bacterium]
MKNLLKKTVKGILGERSKTYVNLYYKFYHKSVFPSMDHIVNLYAKVKPEVFFMQIGANEGSTEDPLYRQIRLRNWKGILVEPLPEEFKNLKNNYKDSPQLIFENVAISHQEESRPFYYVRKDVGGVPFWVTKLSSFDRKIPEEVLETYPKAEIASFDVKCTTVHQLIRKNQVKKVDLLFIDTEGFDYEILKTVDLAQIMPEVIVYEHRHLSADDHKESIGMLKGLGYYVYQAEHDTIAFTNEELKKTYTDHLV